MKTLHHISTKKKLMQLYLTQFSEKSIRDFINDIIRETRPNVSNRCKNISIKESLLFIDRYGLPEGYKLSEEMELRFRELKNTM